MNGKIHLLIAVTKNQKLEFTRHIWAVLHIWQVKQRILQSNHTTTSSLKDNNI